MEEKLMKEANTQAKAIRRSTPGDDFTFFATGCTPDFIANQVEISIRYLKHASRLKFTNACVLAMVSHRSVVEEYIRRKGNEVLNDYIQRFWSVNGRLNFSALNLLGHCYMAATAVPHTGEFFIAFTARIGAPHIWDEKFTGEKLSYQRRKILLKLRAKIKMRDAVRCARRCYAYYVDSKYCYDPTLKPSLYQEEEVKDLNQGVENQARQEANSI